MYTNTLTISIYKYSHILFLFKIKNIQITIKFPGITAITNKSAGYISLYKNYNIIFSLNKLHHIKTYKLQ